MAFDSLTSRSDTSALVPEAVSSAMLTDLPGSSAALEIFRRINVPTKLTRFPVLAGLPIAYWVDGDTGIKQSSRASWSNKTLTVEKLAVVCPTPMDVLDDLRDGGNFDLWEELRPAMQAAIGAKIDAAVFFGDDKPATQPPSLWAGAEAAGNTYARGTNAANAGGIAEDFNQIFAKVEEDGFAVNSIVTDLSFRKRLRGARATDGQKLLDVSTGALDGVPVTYGLDGLWPASQTGDPEVFVGDRNKVIMGVRKDFYWDIWDQAVLQDDEGNIIFNLAQQNLFGLVVEFRVGWVVANPINRRQPNEAARFPFGVLTRPA